jgi:hypothetical protein
MNAVAVTEFGEQEGTIERCADCGTTALAHFGYVTYARAPKDGEPEITQVVCRPCDDTRKLRGWEEDGYLSTGLTVIAAIKNVRCEERGDRYREAFPGEKHLIQGISLESEVIQDRVKDFERRVWFGGVDPTKAGMTEPYRGLAEMGLTQYKGDLVGPEGSLQAFIRPQKRQGHSAKITDGEGREIQLLSLAMCGRWRMTIQYTDTQRFVDIITEESSSNFRMGLNGIGATMDEATALLNATVVAWEAGEITFVDDGEVHILGSR